MVSISDGAQIQELKDMLKGMDGPLPEILYGAEGMVEVARHKDAESVVTGIVGCAGLPPTVAAIEAGKNICLVGRCTSTPG